MNEPKTVPFIKIDKDFCTILICAVRYCLGRQTYMPCLVTEFIRPLLPQLDKNTLNVMAKDIRNAENYGDERIDKPMWMRFLSDIEREINKRISEVYHENQTL